MNVLISFSFGGAVYYVNDIFKHKPLDNRHILTIIVIVNK